MTKAPRKTGSSRAAATNGGDSAQTYDTSAPTQAAAATRPPIATRMSDGPSATATQYQAPPQGPGAPARLRHDGSPHTEANLNAAMKVLLDPAARNLPSRVYSGQSRNWSR